MKKSNRELAQKAFDRMSRYYEDVGLETHKELHETNGHKTAWINGMSDVDIDMLDIQSQMWFMDDEDFEKEYPLFLKRYEYSCEVLGKIAENISWFE